MGEKRAYCKQNLQWKRHEKAGSTKVGEGTASPLSHQNELNIIMPLHLPLDYHRLGKIQQVY